MCTGAQSVYKITGRFMKGLLWLLVLSRRISFIVFNHRQQKKKKPNNNNKLTFVLVSFLRGCQCDVTRIWCLLPLFCKKENCFFFTVIVRTYCMLLAKYKTAVVSQMSKDGKAFTARCQLHLA